VNLLYVDHYDSFAYNIVHLLASQGTTPDVVHSDDPRLTPEIIRRYDALIVGPGPGHPREIPRVLDVIRAALEAKRPLFGVCLGLQAIGEAMGAHVMHAPRVMHGKTSQIQHDSTGVFSGIPTPLRATRYHSLCIDKGTLSEEIAVTALSEDGVVQAIAHRRLPVHAVQFHPESVLSEHGAAIVGNFLRGT
jgi:anthranilate synthase/aminodeoxychorismate synthase-like glutamine amidotransferase